MRYYKNTMTLILTLSLALVFTACSGKSEAETNATTDSNVTVEQNTTAEAGGDDNTTTGGGNDDNATNGGGSDDNTTVGGGTEDNATTGGNDDNTTAGEDENATTPPTVTLASLKLTVDKTSLNRDENTTVKVIATYSDNSTKEVTDNVEWVVIPGDAVKMTRTTLTALQDKTTTVKAKLNTVVSDAISLNITWIVNGHTLPPEPDPTLNDATLLGVDSNNDGVRDDIERKVYATYPKAIQRVVMMQAFSVEQKMLADPDMVRNAREWAMKDIKAMDCDAYLYLHKNKPFIKKMGNVINDWQFNNEKRVKLYIQYNKALSGGVYSINDGTLQDCEFDVEKVLEMD